jgi:mRNA-degrading endonuclease RelE of RelBE toxin-antitoxin system
VTYRLKYTQTFEKRIEKIKKKDKTLMEEATKKVEKLQEIREE